MEFQTNDFTTKNFFVQVLLAGGALRYRSEEISPRFIFKEIVFVSKAKSAKKNFFGEEKFEKKPMLYLGLGICDLFFTGVFIMEKSDFELLPERRASNCGRVSPPRRVRKKTGSLFVVKPFSGGAHFRTVHEFSSYGRMKTLFARQAAFERWGSKNERD